MNYVYLECMAQHMKLIARLTIEEGKLHWVNKIEQNQLKHTWAECRQASTDADIQGRLENKYGHSLVHNARIRLNMRGGNDKIFFDRLVPVSLRRPPGKQECKPH